MKFLCDQMLGTLAKWLRLMGFDTYFADNVTTDDELIAIAHKEKRVLITRDKTLVQKTKKQKIPSIEIKTTDLDEQLQKALQKTKINKKDLLTRCSLCNMVLNPIEKIKVKNRVPERIFEQHTDFLYCPKCDKIYWPGTHYKKILEKITTLNS